MLERLPATPPGLMRGLAMAAVVGQAGIAVTGAVVRVTGSGLGCPTWPQCFPGSLVPVPHPEIAVLHQWVEFGNRLLGIALVIVTAACLLAALAVRPRRGRLVLLAATMPLGVVAQAVIGGITVLTGLAWYTVAPHFLVTIPLIWLAVLLVRESSPAAMAAPPGTPWRPAVPSAAARAARGRVRGARRPARRRHARHGGRPARRRRGHPAPRRRPAARRWRRPTRTCCSRSWACSWGSASCSTRCPCRAPSSSASGCSCC